MTWLALRRLCAAFVLSVCSAGPLAAGDLQAWNEVDLAARWRRLDLTIPFVARIDFRSPNPQLAATGLTADVHLRWGITLTGGYLFVRLPYFAETAVHVPLVAVSESIRAGRMVITDRNRAEKLIGFGNSPVRYRNRLLVQLPLWSRYGAFTDDEVFFNSSTSRWDQNRFRIGGDVRINTRLVLDVYYLQRDLRGQAPATRVIGTTLRVLLTPEAKGLSGHGRG